MEGGGTAYGRIYDVVMEEMLHMGLAGNMLASLGGVPEIPVPAYPAWGLPGGVKPELRVYLKGLTKPVVSELYMEIEKPEHPLARYALYRGRAYPTVAAFYDEISDNFGKLEDSDLTAANQLVDYGVTAQAVFVVDSVKAAQRACLEIKEQGEGTTQSPYDDPDFGGGLAHYYRFAEIFHEKTLVPKTGGGWDYGDPPVPFPQCYPMAEVPAGGYVHQPDLPADVKSNLETFDGAWIDLVRQLRAVWNPAVAGAPNDKMMSAVWGGMQSLKGPAISLMKQPLFPGAAENYGPDWIYLGDTASQR